MQQGLISIIRLSKQAPSEKQKFIYLNHNPKNGIQNNLKGNNMSKYHAISPMLVIILLLLVVLAAISLSGCSRYCDGYVKDSCPTDRCEWIECGVSYNQINPDITSCSFMDDLEKDESCRTMGIPDGIKADKNAAESFCRRKGWCINN